MACASCADKANKQTNSGLDSTKRQLEKDMIDSLAPKTPAAPTNLNKTTRTWRTK